MVKMENDDFIRVEGKVPRRDKAGEEIEADSLGSGGARRSDGTLSAMAYDLREVSDDDNDQSPDATKPGPVVPPWLVEFLLCEVVLPAAKASYPHLKKWLIESAAPAARERWRELKPGRKDRTERSKGRGSSATLAQPPLDEQAHRSQQVAPTFSEPKIRMSSSEWQKGLLAWTEAAAVEEALRRMLTNATLDDDDAALVELQRAVGVLSPEQRSSVANRMLETGSLTLDQELFSKLVKVFGEGRAVDGHFVPVELEQQRQARALPDEAG